MVTYKKIITAAEGMRKIASLDLKVKDALNLARLIKRLDNEFSLYNEQKEKICKKYGRADENKGMYFIPEENRKAAFAELEELEKAETDLGEKIKIKLSESMEIDAASILSAEDFVEFIFEGAEENGN